MTTIYVLLEDYPTVDNVTELLDSDILILPNKRKEGSFGQYQPLGLAHLNNGLNVKYYCNGEPNHRFEASCESVFDLGTLVIFVNFLASLTTISEYIRRHHRDHNIKITIVHGNVYENCQINVYKGNGSDVGQEISDLQENYT